MHTKHSTTKANTKSCLMDLQQSVDKLRYIWKIFNCEVHHMHQINAG